MSNYYVDEIDGVFFTDRTAASDREFAARIAPLEAASAAPESFDPIAALRRVEAVAVSLDAWRDNADLYRERVKEDPVASAAAVARAASYDRAAGDIRAALTGNSR